MRVYVCMCVACIKKFFREKKVLYYNIVLVGKILVFRLVKGGDGRGGRMGGGRLEFPESNILKFWRVGGLG